MPDYIHPAWVETLRNHRLTTFDALWDLRVALLESPNAERGGSSGVARVTLQRPGGDTVAVYLKRQRNHVRRTLRHPWRGEPTFAREFSMLQYLQRLGIAAPVPVFYGERRIDGEPCAILLTEELAGFRALADMLAEMETGKLRLAKPERHRLIAAVARGVRALHACGVHHRSLYAKHIFVKACAGEYRVAFIDLEKSRFSRLPGWRMLQDLATLNYRTPLMSRSERLDFFKCYHAVATLNGWQRWQCRLIAKRSVRKQQRLNKR